MADREQEKADFSWIMADARGRRFIRRMLAICGVSRTTFSASGHEEMLFREGMRNAGLVMLNDIADACPARYIEMVKDE